MEYSNGYVAFIDILGFSALVCDNKNKDKVKALFEYVEKFKYLFNSSPKLKVNVSFFSDSIVISSDKFGMLTIAISIIEGYLISTLGLLFRGGITKGEYYHSQGVTFGPAVITAYQLENKANYSRILIDSCIEVDEETLEIFKDIDGYNCLNLESLCLWDGVVFAPEGPIYDNISLESVLNNFQKKKESILKKVFEYKGSKVVEKYLWRIRPYNYTCDFISCNGEDHEVFKETGIQMDEDIRKAFRDCAISMDDLMNQLK